MVHKGKFDFSVREKLTLPILAPSDGVWANWSTSRYASILFIFFLNERLSVVLFRKIKIGSCFRATFHSETFIKLRYIYVRRGAPTSWRARRGAHFLALKSNLQQIWSRQLRPLVPATSRSDFHNWITLAPQAISGVRWALPPPFWALPPCFGTILENQGRFWALPPLVSGPFENKGG